MPRVAREIDRYFASSEQLSLWKEWQKIGNGSSNFDLCRSCARLVLGCVWPLELKPYNDEPPDVPCFGDGPVAHPPYEEQHPPYRCDLCECKLEARDD